MGARAFRRKMKKLERQEDLKERLHRQYAEQKETEKLMADAMKEAEDYTKHHITGELYTAMAIILRKHPYRWPAAKVMRLLEAVGGVINDLNDKVISDADLVTEGEKYGIRVVWDGKHKYIEGLSEFEEAGE